MSSPTTNSSWNTSLRPHGFRGSKPFRIGWSRISDIADGRSTCHVDALSSGVCQAMSGRCLSSLGKLRTVVVCALLPAQAVAQGTTRLERLLQVEIAALVCEMELEDDIEDGIDREIH